jgi:hypothetical protein
MYLTQKQCIPTQIKEKTGVCPTRFIEFFGRVARYSAFGSHCQERKSSVGFLGMAIRAGRRNGLRRRTYWYSH